jgi:hypothetical protein
VSRARPIAAPVTSHPWTVASTTAHSARLQYRLARTAACAPRGKNHLSSIRSFARLARLTPNLLTQISFGRESPITQPYQTLLLPSRCHHAPDIHPSNVVRDELLKMSVVKSADSVILNSENFDTQLSAAVESILTVPTHHFLRRRTPLTSLGHGWGGVKCRGSRGGLDATRFNATIG